MGNQPQTPQPQSQQQPGTRQPKEDPKSKRATSKEKDAGNVPQSDDDVIDEGSEGSREDATGSRSRNS
jgi:hypothetical protein